MTLKLVETTEARAGGGPRKFCDNHHVYGADTVHLFG